MPVPKLLQPANLLSLSRVILAPIVGYLLYLDTPRATLWSVVVLIIAGLTDWLDGAVARARKQVSQLGIALDPVADKIFAGLLVIFVVLYRDMPLWLAGIVVGRDLVILTAAAVILRGQKIVPSSNHFGKYAFAAIALLLGSYVIRFPFGITMMTWVALILIAASLVSYARTFIILRRGEVITDRDTTLYRLLRYLATAILGGIFLLQLLRFLSEK